MNNNNKLILKSTLLFLFILLTCSLRAEIITQGIGEVEIQPNIAKFDIAIETSNINSETAANLNRTQAKKVIDLLKQILKPGESISTQNYQMLPQYNYNNGTQTFTGFKVVNVISVEYLDLANTGQLLDKIIKSGASRIDNLRFISKYPEKSYQEALALAIDNARDRANIIANSSNLKISGVKIVVAEPDARIDPQTNMTFAASARFPGKTKTPIEVNSYGIVATVEVVFNTQKTIIPSDDN